MTCKGCRKNDAEYMLTWNLPMEMNVKGKIYPNTLVMWPVCEICGDIAWKKVQCSVSARDTFSTLRFNQISEWPKWVGEKYEEIYGKSVYS